MIPIIRWAALPTTLYITRETSKGVSEVGNLVSDDADDHNDDANDGGGGDDMVVMILRMMLVVSMQIFSND